MICFSRAVGKAPLPLAGAQIQSAGHVDWSVERQQCNCRIDAGDAVQPNFVALNVMYVAASGLI